MPSSRSSIAKCKPTSHDTHVVDSATVPTSIIETVPLGKYPTVLVTTLASEFPPQYVIGKIRELLDATRWSKDTLVPDFRARCDGIKILLAYGIGLPVQREELKQPEPPKTDMMERIARSPQARKALKRMWEKAEEQAEQAKNQEFEVVPSRA